MFSGIISEVLSLRAWGTWKYEVVRTQKKTYTRIFGGDFYLYLGNATLLEPNEFLCVLCISTRCYVRNSIDDIYNETLRDYLSSGTPNFLN